MNDIDFGKRVKELLESRNITTREFAKQVGKTEQAIYEVFRKRDLHTSLLREICDMFNIELSYFFTTQSTSLVQVGKLNTIGNDNNVAYKSNNHPSLAGRPPVYVTGNDRAYSHNIDERDVIRMNAEIDALNRENALLREIVDVLKSK